MPRGRPRNTPLPPPQNRLREWRDKRKLTLAQMSALTHPKVPATTIQRHETGAGVDTRYLDIYAQALNVKTEELLPIGNTLDDQERALLQVFKQLDDRGRADLMRLGRALAEHESPPLPAAVNDGQ